VKITVSCGVMACSPVQVHRHFRH